MFDLEPVEAFTRDVLANGGDYSIGFWVKPLGAGGQLSETSMENVLSLERERR